MGVYRWAIAFVLAVAFAPGVQAQAPGSGGRSTQVPAAVYSRLFREVVNLEAKADRLAAKGQPDAAIRHHHQAWLGLTSEQETELKQVAADWSRQNAPLDVQAGSARTALQRVRHESSGAAVATQGQALAANTSQQVALVQSARDSLASAFGPARFVYFESIVRQYAVSKISRDPRPRDCEQQCVVPPGETQQLDRTFEYAYGVPNLEGGPYFGGSYEGVLNAPGRLLFTDRLIGEGFGGTTDTCYSNYRVAGVTRFIFSSQTQGAAWDVGAAFQGGAGLATNHYGYDYVYWQSSEVVAYVVGPMQQAASQGASPACSVAASQSMYVDDCQGNINYSGAPYEVHSMGFSITYNTLTVCANRAGVQACAYIDL